MRRLGPGDEEVLRSVRLRALATDPGAFGSTLAREEAFATADWTRRLSPPAATFVAHVEPDDRTSGAAGGMAWAVPDAADDGLVHLFGMWVAPTARRSGAGGALVDAVVAWAADRGAAAVELTVVEGNAAAERLYHGRGFRRTGVAGVGADGQAEAQMVRPL